MGWWFYHSKVCIDDAMQIPPVFVGPRPDSVELVYATCSMRKLLIPSSDWKPFTPADNYVLSIAHESGSDYPVPVGYNRLLYQVTKGLIKPIYWDEPVYGTTYFASWVFLSTATPVEPSWEEKIGDLVREYRPWTPSYRASLTRAVKSQAEFEHLVRFVEVESCGTVSRLFLLLAPCDDEAVPLIYVFSDYRRFAHERIANHLLKKQAPEPFVATIGPFRYENYQKVKCLDPQPTDTPDFEAPTPEFLILAIHGIGQKLTDRFGGMNFTGAVGNLWREMMKCQAAFVNGRPNFIVLPVNWRDLVNFAGAKYHLESLLMPDVVQIRAGVTDLFVDMICYMSDKRDEIINMASREANRLYRLVLRHHPRFGQNGRVHIVGHSLGSMIAADILTAQPSDHRRAEALLCFDTVNFFSIGSPLALFLYLKDKRLISRRREGSDGQFKPQFGCLAAENIYNVAHEYDLIAYRLNPTVGTGTITLEPTVIGNMSDHRSYVRFLERVKDSLLRQNTREAVPSESDLEQLGLLNKYGQLDWVIPSTSFTFQLFGLFTAHFSYWYSEDFARFLTQECKAER